MPDNRQVSTSSPRNAARCCKARPGCFKKCFIAVFDRAGFERPKNGRNVHVIHFRSLRHTFACHWRLHGGSLDDLVKLLGHVTRAMTMHYSNISGFPAPTHFTIFQHRSRLWSRAVGSGEGSPTRRAFPVVGALYARARHIAHISQRAQGDVGGYAFAAEITGIKITTLYALVHQHRVPHIRRFQPIRLASTSDPVGLSLIAMPATPTSSPSRLRRPPARFPTGRLPGEGIGERSRLSHAYAASPLFLGGLVDGRAEREPFRKPDAANGGARSEAEALTEAERVAARHLTLVNPYWARALRASCAASRHLRVRARARRGPRAMSTARSRPTWYWASTRSDERADSHGVQAESPDPPGPRRQRRSLPRGSAPAPTRYSTQG